MRSSAVEAFFPTQEFLTENFETVIAHKLTVKSAHMCVSSDRLVKIGWRKSNRQRRQCAEPTAEQKKVSNEKKKQSIKAFSARLRNVLFTHKLFTSLKSFLFTFEINKLEAKRTQNEFSGCESAFIKIRFCHLAERATEGLELAGIKGALPCSNVPHNLCSLKQRRLHASGVVPRA